MYSPYRDRPAKGLGHTTGDNVVKPPGFALEVACAYLDVHLGDHHVEPEGREALHVGWRCLLSKVKFRRPGVHLKAHAVDRDAAREHSLTRL